MRNMVLFTSLKEKSKNACKVFLQVSALMFLSTSMYGACPTGVSGTPCQITNKTDLLALKNDSTSWAEAYILTSNIDLSGVTWTPIGNATTAFEGSFDGGNYTISNLSMSTTSVDTGLFGFVHHNTSVANIIIKNLKLDSITVSSTLDYTGALIGRSESTNPDPLEVQISNITLTNASISGHDRVGGIIGGNSRGGMISNISVDSNVSVTGYSYVGGMAGSVSLTNVISSHSNANVTSLETTNSALIGGLTGYMDGPAYMINSYATGDISVKTSRAGGLIGLIGYAGAGVTDINSSFATGNIIADTTSNIGGFVGNISGDSTFNNCYSTGDVNSTGTISYSGGFVGNFQGTALNNVYSVGYIGTDPNNGGLVGYKTGSETNSFYDSDTSGTTTSALGTAKITTLMKTQSTFTGWDFTNVWNIDPSINNGYPYLRDNPPVVPDTTAPTVSSTTPVNVATNVAVDFNATVTFSEVMNASTITNSNITLKDSINNNISGVVTYSGTTATFNPNSNLSNSKEYNLTVSTAVADTAGNALASAYSFSFTTIAPLTVEHNVTVGGVSTTATFDIDVTTVDNAGARESNVTMGVNNSDVNVTAYSDGKAFHLVKTAASPKITKANFDILGATSHINTDGDIETKISPITYTEAGCTLKAIITTYNNGESYSRFVRNCGSDEIKETSLEATPFELGNKIRVYETAGEMTIEVNATITREIKF